MRELTPEPEKLYTWWSYRAMDNWKAADRGRRLDHIWVSPQLGDRVSRIDIAKARARLGAAVGSRAGDGGDRGVRRMMTDAINLAEKLATFSEYFSPRTVTQLNDYDVMVVKVKGEFVWHKHDDTDDFFLVLKGELDIELRDRTVTLRPGEMFVVPKGVEHRPVAREEVHLLLIEPTGTPNTGDAKTAAARKLATLARLSGATPPAGNSSPLFQISHTKIASTITCAIRNGGSGLSGAFGASACSAGTFRNSCVTSTKKFR